MSKRAYYQVLDVPRTATEADIKKAYRKRQVVKGVSLAVGRGESVGLIGPNGAGKTTLFNCISRLYQPTEGTITYNGRDLLGIPAHARDDQ